MREKLVLLKQYNEDELIDQLKQGDTRAFNLLYKTYSSKIYRLGCYMIHDETKAQDLVQETFIRFFRNTKKLKSGGSLKSWIYRIARNLAINELKRISRQRKYLVDDNALNQFGSRKPENMPEQHTIVNEQIELIKQKLKEFPPKKRMTFILFFIEEMTADEVSSIMKEGRGTILKRVQRLREELKTAIDTQKKCIRSSS